MESGLKLWGIMTASAIVLSNDSPTLVKSAARLAKVVFGERIQICDGTNDHVEINAALAIGGETHLTSGSYDIQDTSTMPTLSTLSGCGANTVLRIPDGLNGTFSVISSTGTSQVVVKDLKIDGGTQTGGTNQGVLLTNVSEGEVHDCFITSMAHWTNDGVQLSGSTDCCIKNNLFYLCGAIAVALLASSDSNRIIGNHIKGCGDGVDIDDSSQNIMQGNQFEDGDWNADIYIMGASHRNLIDSNIFNSHSDRGIYCTVGNYNVISNNLFHNTGDDSIDCRAAAHYTTIIGNTIEGCGSYSLTVYECNYCVVTDNIIENSMNDCIWIFNSNHCNISHNLAIAAAQDSGGYYDIHIEECDYCLVEGNTCRAGDLTFKPTFGIFIDAGVGNKVVDNDLYDDGFVTAPFSDTGTDTKLAAYVVPFSDGEDPQDSGYLIDADTEYARAWLRLPTEVQQVVRMKVYARSVVAEVHKMELQMVVYGGADNQPYTTHDGSIAQLDGASVNFAANDIIFWINTEAGTLALVGGDSVEVKVLHEALQGDNCATNAYFRTVEIEYV